MTLYLLFLILLYLTSAAVESNCYGELDQDITKSLNNNYLNCKLN